jgi:hypothetical protein
MMIDPKTVNLLSLPSIPLTLKEKLPIKSAIKIY